MNTHYYSATQEAESRPAVVNYTLPVREGTASPYPDGVATATAAPVPRPDGAVTFATAAPVPHTDDGAILAAALPRSDAALPRVISFITDSGVFSKNRVDFGTDLLIRSIAPLSGDVLDLGCGYGVIGASLAILNPNARFWFADINRRAVSLCARNIELFSALDLISAETVSRIFCSDGISGITAAPEFDTVVMNPPIRTGKANIFRLYAQACAGVKQGGSLYVVIQKKQGLESTRAELARLFGSCRDIARKAGYHILKAQTGNVN